MLSLSLRLSDRHGVYTPPRNFLSNSANSYVSSLSYRSKRVVSLSQFGQIYTLPETLEHNSAFMQSHAYKYAGAPKLSGRSRVDAAESCITEASSRIDHLLSDQGPSHEGIHHSNGT